MRPTANWVPVLHAGSLWQMGGLRKRVSMGLWVWWAWWKMSVGLWVWWVCWVLIEDSVARGFMRFTANGVLFLGCRGWMWVVGGLGRGE